MSIRFNEISLTPNTVDANGHFIVSVTAEQIFATHAMLADFTHGELGAYTHDQIRNAEIPLGGE